MRQEYLDIFEKIKRKVDRELKENPIDSFVYDSLTIEQIAHIWKSQGKSIRAGMAEKDVIAIPYFGKFMIKPGREEAHARAKELRDSGLNKSEVTAAIKDYCNKKREGKLPKNYKFVK